MAITLGLNNVQVPYGCTCKWQTIFTGADPRTITTTFDTANWTITGRFIWNNQTKSITIEVINSTTILCTIDESIYSDITASCLSYSAVSIPALPASFTGVSKTDGKTFILANFTVQIIPVVTE